MSCAIAAVAGFCLLIGCAMARSGTAKPAPDTTPAGAPPPEQGQPEAGAPEAPPSASAPPAPEPPGSALPEPASAPPAAEPPAAAPPEPPGSAPVAPDPVASDPVDPDPVDPDPPAETVSFSVEATDGIHSVIRLLESISGNSALTDSLEGLGITGATNDTGAATMRTTLGLPDSGTEFDDASGLGSDLADTEYIFGRNERGVNGAVGFGGVLANVNWVDGLFYGTAFDSLSKKGDPPPWHLGVASLVIGIPAAANPAAADGTTTAVWSGTVTGRDYDDIGHLSGTATLTYDFSADTLDVAFGELAYHPGGSLIGDPMDDITWDDLAVANGLFGDCSGTDDCVRGRFFDDDDNTAAAAVGGVGRQGSMYMAFGADRN